MAALCSALAMFLLALAVHALVWRVRVPRMQTRTLFIIFAAVPACLALLVAATGRPPPSVLPPVADVPAMGLFYLGAVGCYLITYAGVEEASPSLLIIRTLEAAGEHGCTREELSQVVTDARFVAPRIAALKRDQVMVETPEGNLLTPRGARIAFVAGLLARCFRMDTGG